LKNLNKFIWLQCAVFVLLLLSVVFSAHAQDITLRVTALEGGNHAYFHELLTRSLEEAGHSVSLETLGVVPFKRGYAMLESGESSINWFHRARAADFPFVPIPVGITNNLIGKRVLVIPEGMGSVYAQIKNLNMLKQKQLVGGFGKGWYDVRVWEANDLPFIEKDGEWRQLFPMIASKMRGVDYLSRGVGEVLNEMEGQAGLEIESNLLFVYESDYWFFLSPSAAHLRPVIESALLKAKESGVVDELVQKYWGNDFNKLKLDQRTVIRMNNP